MAAAGVIREFLASVGFRADEKSLKSSLTKVVAFGAAVQMTAVGICAGLIKVASGEMEIARKAELLGTSSEKLQELGYVAEQSGAGVGALTKSIESLVSRNPRIKDGAAALERAGERMRRMSEAQRKAYADNMGIDRALIPMLISDTGKLTEEFRQMYAVAGYDAKEAAKSSREFMGEIGKLSTMAGLLAKSVALAFMGRIRHDVANLRKVIMENFDKLKRVFEGIIKVVLRIASVISGFAYRIITWISALVGWYDKLDDGQKNVVAGIGLLLAAWKLLNAGFLATPIGMIIAGLLGIVALVDDYLTFMEGGESYFDWSEWAGTIEEVLAALKPILGVVLSIGSGIASAIGPALRSSIATIGRVITHFKLLGELVMAIFSGDFAAAADIAKAIISNMIDLVVGIFTGFRDMVRTILGSLWDGVVENFPDFAAWATKATEPIREIFGGAIQWIRDKINKLVGFLPEWVKKKMGLNQETAGDGEQPGESKTLKPAEAGTDRPSGEGQGGGGGPGASEAHSQIDVDKAIETAVAATQAASGPALVPGPAQAAAITNSTQQDIRLDAKTEIHMHTSDPVTAGNQVADRQTQVNADTVRHMKGAAK